MRQSLIFFVPILALGGCAAEKTAEKSAAQSLAAMRPVGEAVACIDPKNVVSRRPVGSQTLVFEVIGGKTYRNDLPAACPGLERSYAMDTMVFELHGGNMCRNDQFRVVDPTAMQTVGYKAFPICRLGSFTPVKVEQ